MVLIVIFINTITYEHLDGGEVVDSSFPLRFQIGHEGLDLVKKSIQASRCAFPLMFQCVCQVL